MGSFASSYLRATWRIPLCFAALMLLLNLVLFLSAPLRDLWGEIAYLDLLLSLVALAFYGYGFLRYRSLRRQVFQAVEANIAILPALDENARDEPMRILRACVSQAVRLKEQKISTLEDELQEQRDLLARWAHEIKTPLAVCRLTLARERDESVKNSLAFQLARIEAQVRSVLHAERLRHLEQSAEMTPLDVPSLLRAALSRGSEPLRARDLEVNLQAPPVEAVSDEGCVAYILDQMISNAAKYAKKSSMVRVEARQEDERACLSVTNLGRAIEARYLDRVFDKGFASGNASSGMGLYYARQTARALGGRITVSSTDRETTFTLELPRFSLYLAPAGNPARRAQ